MELRFEASQEHQLRAVEAVTGLFQGQPLRNTVTDFELGLGAATVPNRLDLDETALLENLRVVQARNNIRPDGTLAFLDTPGGTFPNFSVDMETGTGKTYVYLRTALELAVRYGLRKYIVVVPSVAVREGVLATLRATRTHFAEVFGQLPYQFARYDSATLHQVREFAVSPHVQILVMTLDAFNKAANVIGRSNDQLQGETPLHLIQAVRPVLILDEPQNMESGPSRAALASLKPLLALRYSATHRTPYNVVYRLSPHEAYRRSLVKRIEVAGMVQEGEVGVFLRLDRIESKKGRVRARVTVQVPAPGGALREKTLSVGPGDDLGVRTQRPEYRGYVVREIDRLGGALHFGGAASLRLGEVQGPDQHALWKAQIRYTVEEHFRKQRALRELGIKVLSLFFLDRVEHYAPQDGVIRRLFTEAFLDLREQYPEWQAVEPGDVQAAYFAQRRTRGGGQEAINTTGENRPDEAAFTLIMREKERLLSFGVPVAFVFSHSALREGWDNPNVFQVCTLNQAVSETRRRQEIGRGVRLAVNQEGTRVHDGRVNVLTVVASEAYGRYVSGLQRELALEYRTEVEARSGKPIGELTAAQHTAVTTESGAERLPPPPENARQRGEARLRGDHLRSPEFQTLWDRIKPRTRFRVTLDTERLLAAALPEIDALSVRPPQLRVTRAAVVTEGSAFAAEQLSGTRTVTVLERQAELPNLVELMEGLLAQGSPPLRLTRKTLFEVYHRTTNREAALHNPQEFAALAVAVLRRKLTEQIVQGVRYFPDGTWYETQQFGEVVPSWQQHLVPAGKALYDHVTVDSRAERQFVRGLEERQDVRLYVKLPGWFQVPTPFGNYTPDWAIVMEPRDGSGQPTGGELLSLVCVTQATAGLENLRTTEQQKILCATEHFRAIGVDYRVVTSAEDLP